MARKIIITTVERAQNGGRKVTAVFWLDVVNGAAIPRPGFVSAVAGLPGTANDPTQAESDALIAGTLIEEVHSADFPDNVTNAQLQNALVAHYTQRQTAIAARPNIWQNAGRFWDGAAWAAGA